MLNKDALNVIIPIICQLAVRSELFKFAEKSKIKMVCLSIQDEDAICVHNIQAQKIPAFTGGKIPQYCVDLLDLFLCTFSKHISAFGKYLAYVCISF